MLHLLLLAGGGLFLWASWSLLAGLGRRERDTRGRRRRPLADTDSEEDILDFLDQPGGLSSEESD